MTNNPTRTTVSLPLSFGKSPMSTETIQASELARRPLKVCFVVGAMNVGGVQTFLLHLGRFLVRSGHAVTVLTTRERGEWWSRLAKAGMKGECMRSERSFNPLIHAYRIGRYLSRSDFDVVVLNHAREAQLPLGMLPDSVVVVPIVHNDTQGIYRVATLNPSAWNVLVAVSPRLAVEASSRAPQKRVEQINYAVNVPSEKRWKRRRSWRRDLALIYVGRLIDHQKGVMLLPELLQVCLLDDGSVSLTIVGDGPDRDRLQRAFVKTGSASRVRFLGSLSLEESLDQMLRHHVLIMPSRYEGLGIVALEAQACGCVPVATRLPGVTDHSLVDGETGFLADLFDVTSFARPIKALLRSQALWERMSQAGRHRVQELFTVEAMGKAYERLLRKAVSGGYPLPRSRSRQWPLDIRGLTWRDLVPNVLRRLRNARRPHR